MIECCASLLLGTSVQVEHLLEIVGLRDEPFVDELLRIVGEGHVELATHAQLIRLLDELVDARVQRADLGQRGALTRRQERLHLIAHRVVDLHVDVVDRRSLRLIGLNT